MKIFSKVDDLVAQLLCYLFIISSITTFIMLFIEPEASIIFGSVSLFFGFLYALGKKMEGY